MLFLPIRFGTPRIMGAIAATRGDLLSLTGLLNVFLAPEWCALALRDVLVAGREWGRGRTLEGQRVRVEFVSANPTGPLVIVNARAAAVGDALVRLLRWEGARVISEYYVND